MGKYSIREDSKNLNCSFDSLEELQDFVKEEISFNKLMTLDNSLITQSLKNVSSALFSSFKILESHIDSAIKYKDNNNPEFAEKAAKAAIQKLKEIFSLPIIYSKSPDGIFIDKLRAQNPEVAAIALAYMVYGSFGPERTIYNISEAVSLVNLRRSSQSFDEGIKEDYLSSALNGVNDVKHDLKLTLNESREKLALLSSNFEGFIQESIDNVSTEHASRSEKWAEIVTKADEDIVKIKESYDLYSALTAPATYWERKRRQHRILSIVFGIVSLIVIMGGGAYLYTLVSGGEFIVSKSTANAVTATQTPDYHNIAATFILGTIFFWVARMLVRLFMSNLHLENDAAERITMLKTYLALFRRNRIPEGDDLKTILAALFRASGDGIVKDEAMPLTIMEHVTKLKP
ncbi:DUF6161 domain-containing protein [Pseudomonas luteola]|uniref:DUF6161 domain-containing protein n=1 Tax=Pseudomonas luteola TaxID=47886 RepID=A0ABS0FIF0_PSELU|nr:DUF6161 domain-containing protein [Pseudomonas zeshuii]MBF8640121.1 hypothetical protein [Pseudomonas zeshuii]